MVEELRRTIAYICPACRQSVIIERGLFQLAAAPNTLPCPCGKSALRVEMTGDRVKLEVPCLYCREEHSVSCSAKSFLHQRALAFSCSASGLDCCYVGEKEPVYAAMSHLEQAVDKLEREEGERGSFLDELVMHEVLSELKEIAQRGGISCTCGAKQWKLQVNFSSVDLICGDCGGVARLNAATAGDIDDICCRSSIVIQGR